MDIEELKHAQYEQFKILSHAYKIRRNIIDSYSIIKLSTIINKLISSVYFDKDSSIVLIKSTELDKLFELENLRYQAILIILGRNKIAYKKFVYRPKVQGRQLVLYNLYQIFLAKSDLAII